MKSESVGAGSIRSSPSSCWSSWQSVPLPPLLDCHRRVQAIGRHLRQKPVWLPTEWVVTNFEAVRQAHGPLFEILGLVGPPPARRLPLAGQHRVHGSGGHGAHLPHRRHGGLRSGKEAVPRPCHRLRPHRMRHGPPKQVILIPLLREMSALNLYGTLWAVIFPSGLALRRVPDEAVSREHPRRDSGGRPGGRLQ